MAEIKQVYPNFDAAAGSIGLFKVVLNTTGQYVLPAWSKKAHAYYLHVILGGAAPGDFTLKQRLHGSALAVTSSNLFAPPFADVESDTIKASGTAIIAAGGAGLYYVPNDGCDLILDYTSGADGMTVYATPVIGA